MKQKTANAKGSLRSKVKVSSNTNTHTHPFNGPLSGTTQRQSTENNKGKLQAFQNYSRVNQAFKNSPTSTEANHSNTEHLTMTVKCENATDQFCLQSTAMWPAPPHFEQMIVLVTIVWASWNCFSLLQCTVRPRVVVLGTCTSTWSVLKYHFQVLVLVLGTEVLVLETWVLVLVLETQVLVLEWLSTGYNSGQTSHLHLAGHLRMNEVNARQARLVPGWLTVFGQVYHLGM